MRSRRWWRGAARVRGGPGWTRVDVRDAEPTGATEVRRRLGEVGRIPERAPDPQGNVRSLYPPALVTWVTTLYCRRVHTPEGRPATSRIRPTRSFLVHPPQHVRRWMGGAAAASAAVLVASSLSSAPAAAGPAVDSSAGSAAEVTPEGITAAPQRARVDRRCQRRHSRLRHRRLRPRASTTWSREARQRRATPRGSRRSRSRSSENSRRRRCRRPRRRRRRTSTPDDFATHDVLRLRHGHRRGRPSRSTPRLTPTTRHVGPADASPRTSRQRSSGTVALMQRGSCTVRREGRQRPDRRRRGGDRLQRRHSRRRGLGRRDPGRPAGEPGIPALGASFALGQDLADPAGTTGQHHQRHGVGDPGHLQRARTRPRVARRGTRHPGRRPPRQRGRRTGHQRQRQRLRVPARGRRGDGRREAAQQGALLVVGRRGARPARAATHYVADLAANDPAALGQDRDVPELRHGGLPELRPVRLRRRQLGVPARTGRRRGPVRIRRDRGDCSTTTSRSQGLASEETRSAVAATTDPFIAEGIPSGGLFTGAEGLKTAAQAAVYGGQAGVAYDHCYHADCDDIGNVNMEAIDEMSDAMAHAVYTYSLDASSVTKAARWRQGRPRLGHRRAPAEGARLRRAGPPRGATLTR